MLNKNNHIFYIQTHSESKTKIAKSIKKKIQYVLNVFSVLFRIQY